MTLLAWAQMSAEINTDLNQRIVQTPDQALWYESPAKDIHRRPLE
ncbi:cupin, partial [Klebsiella pneumoniae]